MLACASPSMAVSLVAQADGQGMRRKARTQLMLYRVSSQSNHMWPEHAQSFPTLNTSHKRTTAQALMYKIPHSSSQLLPLTLPQRLLPINKHTPPLPTPRPIPKPPNRSPRKLPLSISKLIRPKTPRLQPHRLNPRISCLLQHHLRHRRRRDNAQARFSGFL